MCGRGRVQGGGGEDERRGGEDGRTHDVLADVADRLERRLAHDLAALRVGDVLRQLRDEVRPPADRQLRARDVRDALRRRARPTLRAQRREHLQAQRPYEKHDVKFNSVSLGLGEDSAHFQKHYSTQKTTVSRELYVTDDDRPVANTASPRWRKHCRITGTLLAGINNPN